MSFLQGTTLGDQPTMRERKGVPWKRFTDYTES